MQEIEVAILRTVLYADVFNFPLTTEEIHHFLIHHEAVPLETVAETLQHSAQLRTLLEMESGYVVRAGRAELVALRRARERFSHRLWPEARRWGVRLARMPFVRMVAVTGALAVQNVADGQDDLDYILVTKPGRVWLARAFAILLVRLGRLLGVEVCPNYVLAGDRLAQANRNLFMAHEVVQMVPLYGQAIYARMRAANAWTHAHMPNANGPFHAVQEYRPGRVWRTLKRALEFVLGGHVGDALERWEYRRKLQRFTPAMQQPHSAAQIDDSMVKGHFEDYGHPTIQQYRARLREYGLVPMPGD